MRANAISKDEWPKRKNLKNFKNRLRWIDLFLQLIYMYKRLYRVMAEGRYKAALLKRITKITKKLNYDENN